MTLLGRIFVPVKHLIKYNPRLQMWADAQRDGRTAEYMAPSAQRQFD